MDFKKIVIVALVFLAVPFQVQAKAPSYEKILKHWTRHEQVFTWDNFEARMIWNATYLSDEFRDARRQKMSELYDWNNEELLRQIRLDSDESRSADVFIVSIYAGSSVWPEIGKDDANWHLMLETDDGHTVQDTKFEPIPVTQIERTLYPYIDKWSHLYRVSFPKTIHGDHFRLRMSGIPAKSELVWKR